MTRKIEIKHANNLQDLSPKKRKIKKLNSEYEKKLIEDC